MLTLGSDPEFFLVNSEGKPISSIRKLRGTKRRPRKTEHGFIQEDNVLAEVNTNIATTREEFINNHLLVIKDLEDIIKPLDLSVDISASQIFDDDQLNSSAAWIAGCDEDLNAWTRSPNDKPEFNSNLRTAGGHIHIGYDNAELYTSLDFCKALDANLGLKSVLLDNDILRRSLYGKAGACRLKNEVEHGYNGFEYRVLSNFWCKSVELLGMVYDSIVETYNNLEEKASLANNYAEDIQKAINTSDKPLAEKVLKLCYNM